MAKRCIDADELTKRLKATCDIVCQYSKDQRDVMCVLCGLGSALEVLDDFPTVDVQEVKRGRWERVTRDVCLQGGEFLYTEERTECSCCHKEPLFSYWHNELKSSYCPFCGAKMDGAEK